MARRFGYTKAQITRILPRQARRYGTHRPKIRWLPLVAHYRRMAGIPKLPNNRRRKEVCRGSGMKTFQHAQWNGKRDYECTNVVACRAATAPDESWLPCEESALPLGMIRLWIMAGVEYWGYL